MAAKRKSKRSVKPPYDPRRHHGRPSIGFPVGPTVASWAAPAGGPLCLPFIVRSTGGQGEGFWVRVSGAALSQLAELRVRIGTDCIAMQDDGDGVRAEVPGVPLAVGVVYPLDPKPKNDTEKARAKELVDATQVSFDLLGTAGATSYEMLSISVGAMNSEAPAMKWIRPLVVSAAT